MDSLELAHYITEIIVDKQGEEVLVLDLRDVTTITDYFIICSGTSRRHLNALQSAIREGLKKSQWALLPNSLEGTPDSGWILLDYNGVIVHLFDPLTRSYYDLEELWHNGKTLTHIQ